LTVPHKKQRKRISLELLAWYGAEVNNFLTLTVMGDKRHKSIKKRQLMERHHVDSPQNKKFKAAPLSGVMATVF
jgi:hypothetical protein